MTEEWIYYKGKLWKRKDTATDKDATGSDNEVKLSGRPKKEVNEDGDTR